MLTATTSSISAVLEGAFERAGARYLAGLREARAALASGRGTGPPVRAPGVRLCGELAGSGFQERQWLVERDGRFVQLTELLYRVVEQADGSRSLDDVAVAVARETGRPVSAGNVATLVERVLAPAGLVVPAGATAPPVSGARRDPLAVRMRLHLLGPRSIDPLAGALRWLFWPPLLVVALVAVVLGHAWLYLVRGVDPAWVAGVLIQPGHAGTLLGLILAGGLIHELGHAAALRYGGGRVRGIGAGWYLVYPVFYTDVTDAYRLGRWGRVRTDLGGIYFHLLFTLGLIVAYQWSGAPALLLAAVVINLEVLRQSLPFLRLDAYWTLTDLAGVPDLLSQIGPFLRSVVPMPWWKGARLPRLRRWVRAVFAIYLVVTVPLLALMLVAFLRAMPVTLGVTAASALAQWERLVAAAQAARLADVVAAGLHLLYLGFLSLGIALMIVSLLRSAGRLVLLAARVVLRRGPGRRSKAMSPIRRAVH